MRKRDELREGCMARAGDDEMTFVLLSRDPAAPATIRYWAMKRFKLGKNRLDDPQITEAEQCALTMEAERPRYKPRGDAVPAVSADTARIAALEADNARLREALQQCQSIADLWRYSDGQYLLAWREIVDTVRSALASADPAPAADRGAVRAGDEDLRRDDGDERTEIQ